jgi:hypothetical protein
MGKSDCRIVIVIFIKTNEKNTMKKRKELKEIAVIYCEEYSKKSFRELLSFEYPVELEVNYNNKRCKVEIM